MQKEKVVIIGGVAAGMSTAAKLRRMNADIEITVYQQESIVSYGACGLPYYISNVITDGNRLVARTPEDFQKNNIDVKVNHVVTHVDPNKKKVVVENTVSGETFEKQYDKLVIATGASPILPGFLNMSLKNVYSLRTVADAVAIKNRLQSGNAKRVAIIGAGYIGMELVESMVLLGVHTTLIDRGEIMSPYDEEIRGLIYEEVKRHNVETYLADEVEGLLGETEVIGVKTNKGTYEADTVIVAIGVSPNTKFLQGTNIEQLRNGAIVVDDKMRTSIPDIYAAGDCVTVYHKVLKKNVYIPLGTHANKQGRILGNNLGGGDAVFPGVLGTSVVKILDLTIGRTGVSENEAKEHGFDYKTVFVKSKSHAGYYPDSKDLFIKLIYDATSKRLLGAQIAGDQSAALRIDILAVAIENNMTTKQISAMDLAYAPPFAGVWDAVQVATNAAN